MGLFWGSILRYRLGKGPILTALSVLAVSLVFFFYLAPQGLASTLQSSIIPIPDSNGRFTVTESDLADIASKNYDTDGKDDDSSPRRLRIFMPADKPSINLCKTIMSSVALGYPLPTLLNWDGDFNRPEWHFGGSHIAKLESLLAVIDELLRSGEAGHEDLALMVDAYDLWFQLPPSALIQRYHQLNREADERNRRLWDEDSDFQSREGSPISAPKQSIIVTGAKDCNPDSNSGSNPHYELWPPSPMPDDMYGDETDQQTFSPLDASRIHRRVRPRCVNSGMIMGTMGALRDALARCTEKVNIAARAGRQLWSDQALFADVMGDQFAWRLFARELAANWNGTASEAHLSTQHPHVRDIAQRTLAGERFEFGIGIDYNFTTIPPTCSSEEDGFFVQMDDTADLAAQSEKAGVPHGAVRVSGVPHELASASEINNGPYLDIKWPLQPLYSDFFFGNTPVGIHHNAYSNGLKPFRLKDWWPRMWFYPVLRSLVSYSLDIRSKASRTMLKMTGDDKKEITYEAPQEEKVTVFIPARGSESPASFEPIDWDGVCQKGSAPWYKEIFGDDNGPLVEA